MGNLLNMSGGSLLNKGLPYDAEIEYLESTGTQYIDTGVALYINDTLEVELCNTTEANAHSENKGFGSSSRPFNGPSDIGGGLRFSNGAVRAAICGKNILAVPLAAVTIGKWFKEYFTFATPLTYNLLDINGGQLYTSTSSNAIQENNYNIYLFKSNSLSYPFPGWKRIRRFKITHNNTAAVDLIPVRVGTTGYMYDKVSGQLFGNSGTGNFILGNDI